MPSSKSNKPAKNPLEPPVSEDLNPEEKQSLGVITVSPKVRRLVSSGKFALGLVIFVALVLRIAGMGWGLPNEQRFHSLHPDEPIVFSYSQTIDPVRLNFDPGFYNYGTLYLTMLRVASDMAEVYAGGDEIQTEQDVANYFRRGHLAGRWISVIFGALTAGLVVVALWGRTHPLGAYLGGMAMAFAPGHVIHSRFQTVDVVATFFVIAGLVWLVWRVGDIRSPQIEASSKAALWASLVSGALIGLSAGTKYSGIVAIAGVALILFFAYRRSAWRLIAFSALASLVAFLVSTPGAILNTSQFLQDVRFEMLHTSTGHGLVFAGTAPGFITQLANLVAGYGFLLLIFSIGGIVYALRERAYWTFGLLIFALITYILIGRAEVKFFRYAIPLIPVLTIMFGYWLGEIHRRQVKAYRLWVMLGIIAIGGIGGGGASYAIVATAWMQDTDPRDSAGAWLREEVGPTESVGLVKDPWFWSVTLYPQMAAGPGMASLEDRERWLQESSDPRAVLFAPMGFRSYEPWDPRLITELEPEWIAVTAFEIEGLDRLSRMSNPPEEYREVTERFIAFRDLLEARYEVPESARSNYLIEAGPSIHDLMYIRPQVWLWKKKGTSTNSLTR